MNFTYRDMSFQLENTSNEYVFIHLGNLAYSVPLKYEINRFLNHHMSHSQIYYMVLKKLLEFKIISSPEREIRMAMVDEYIGYERTSSKPTSDPQIQKIQKFLTKRDSIAELKNSFWGELVVEDIYSCN